MYLRVIIILIIIIIMIVILARCVRENRIFPRRSSRTHIISVCFTSSARYTKTNVLRKSITFFDFGSSEWKSFSSDVVISKERNNHTRFLELFASLGGRAAISVCCICSYFVRNQFGRLWRIIIAYRLCC